MKFKHLVWLSAFILAACAAFVSVSGLSKLFAGGGLAVYIMIGGLELSKLVSASLLHRYWSKLSVLIRTYLTIGVIVLISITSMGIYGYLSDGYKKVSTVMSVEQSESSIYGSKIQRFEKVTSDNERIIKSRTDRVTSLTNLRTQQENRLDSLLIKNFISNANKTRADIEKSTDEISRINDEINGLLEANNVLFDSISEYQVKINNVVNNSEVASELGPLIFLSETTGLPIQSVVNYLIIIIMLVFDPLAVILLISANKLDEIDKIDIDKRQYTTTEPIMTNNTFDVNTNETSVPDETIDKFDVISGETENTVVQEVNPDEKTENSLSETINNTIKRIIPENNPFNKRQPVIPRGKMTRDDIPLVKEAVNRGFTVRVPNPKTR
jgi:hypothetical protein